MQQVALEYTFASTAVTSIPSHHRKVFAAANWGDWAAGLPPPHELGARCHGDIVTDQRSSWVRRIATTAGTAYIKTYRYGSWSDRTRNLAKWTAPLRASRAAREAAALEWLARHALQPALALACFEWRRFGFVERATLVTREAPGIAADRALQTATPDARRALLAAIDEFVARLHEHGFFDGNLDLRNLIVRDAEHGPVLAKIDSPRFRIARPTSRTARRLQSRDRARLAPQLAPHRAADAHPPR